MVVDVPKAPWLLEGECMAAVVRGRPHGVLPVGLRPLPGPQLLLGVRYLDSPVGPYTELALAEPARLGMRPGLCVTAMVVDSPASQVGGRLNWGFPKRLGTLRWEADGDERELVWDEGGVRLRVRGGRVGLPAVLPLRAVQRRPDGPVLVNASVRGLLRFGDAEVEVDAEAGAETGAEAGAETGAETGAGGSMAALAGRHRGVLLAGLRATFRPARHPHGALSSFRAAPRAEPEPALSCEAL